MTKSNAVGTGLLIELLAKLGWQWVKNYLLELANCVLFQAELNKLGLFVFNNLLRTGVVFREVNNVIDWIEVKELVLVNAALKRANVSCSCVAVSNKSSKIALCFHIAPLLALRFRLSQAHTHNTTVVVKGLDSFLRDLSDP